MNIALWVLQVIMALHTAIGAVWKFSHSAEQTMPSLKAIPSSVWLSMSVLELICSFCLIVPAFYKPLAFLIPLACLYLVLEMILFSGLHVFSGAGGFGPIVYWLIVALISAFIAYGRFLPSPLS